MLALIRQLAALYAGHTEDQALVAAVNEVQSSSRPISARRLWQKIMIIGQLGRAPRFADARSRSVFCAALDPYGRPSLQRRLPFRAR